MNQTVSDHIKPLILSMVSSLTNDETKIETYYSAVNLIADLSITADEVEESQIKLITQEEFQSELSSVNEKETRRKSDGVYYTPKDVTEFITCNAFINYTLSTNTRIYNTCQAKEKFRAFHIDKVQKLLNSRILDPTCGSGEFLVMAAKIKIEYLISKNKRERPTINQILQIAGSFFGNDIEKTSIELSKLRLFFFFAQYIDDNEAILNLAAILNANFSLFDFVIFNRENFGTFDIVIGNPPYVEYNKLPIKPSTGMGNAYADVLINSEQVLAPDGVLAFIVPLSLVSTPRMGRLREHLSNTMRKQYFLNYADRPDCLFVSVHQKLTIYLGAKASLSKQVYSSNYNYWYKSERENLFDRTEIFRSKYSFRFGIPKIGNEIESSIFKKVFTDDPRRSLSGNIFTEGEPIYLNMRGCFWMKAFTFNPGSKEYNEYKYDKSIASFIHCLLNSSLFFFFWIAISDCWHITSKELNSFRVAVLDQSKIPVFESLSKELETELERTKVYIGSKQTEYEYKHKDCKHVIDKIDRALQHVYNLSDDELSYLINFNLRYRTSNGE